MRIAAIALLGLAAVTAFGQVVPQLRIKRQPVQIKIRHADPWAVKTLLEGGELRHPELSTILALMGGGQGQGQPGAGAPGQGGNANNGLFPDGKFIVNPGDNTLWFIPNP